MILRHADGNQSEMRTTFRLDVALPRRGDEDLHGGRITGAPARKRDEVPTAPISGREPVGDARGQRQRQCGRADPEAKTWKLAAEPWSRHWRRFPADPRAREAGNVVKKLIVQGGR